MPACPKSSPDKSYKTLYRVYDWNMDLILKDETEV